MIKWLYQCIMYEDNKKSYLLHNITAVSSQGMGIVTLISPIVDSYIIVTGKSNCL